MPPRLPRPALVLLAVGLAFEGGLLALLAIGNLRQHLAVFLALWTALFTLMLLAHATGRSLHGRWGLFIILAGAALFRLTLVPAWPTLSDDIYRYLWDGRLVVEGINPYAFVPADEALAGLRDAAVYPHLNSPAFHSVYPPLSQALFALAVAVSDLWFDGSPAAAAVVLKLMLVGFDLGSVALLAGLVRQLGLALRHVLLYAWHPLPIVEFAGSGHADAPMIFGLLLVLWAVGQRRGGLACVGLAAAALSKALPVLLVPFVLRRIGWRYLPVVAAMGLAGAWPLLAPDRVGHYLASVRLYFAYFEFNAGLYLALKQVGWWWLERDVSKTLGPAMGAAQLLWVVAVYAWFRQAGGGDGGAAARAAAAAGGVAVGEARGEARSDHESGGAAAVRPLAIAMMAVLGGYLVLATTVHPWYVTWVLCLVPLVPGIAWVWLSFAVGWSYLAYAIEPARLSPWVVAMTWGVFAGLLVVDWRAGLLERVMRARAAWKVWRIQRWLAGTSLLDVGAGDGWVARRIATRCARRVALLDVVDFNRTHLPLVRYDGRRMPFRDGAFDTVIVLTVLHHCDDPERVLDECVRVCGGRLIVTESVYRTAAGRRVLTAMDRFFNRLRSGGAMEGPLHFGRVEAWRAAFERRGLRLVTERWLSRGLHRHVLFVLDKAAPAAGPEPTRAGQAGNAAAAR